VIFAAITLYVASQRVFAVVVSLSTQFGNFWIHSRILLGVPVLNSNVADAKQSLVPLGLHYKQVLLNFVT
jgi:hypothetical protein